MPNVRRTQMNLIYVVLGLATLAAGEPRLASKRDGTQTLNPTSRVMVDISDDLYGFGGGDVTAAELITAAREGKRVQFVPAEMNHQLSTEWAIRHNYPVPTSFGGIAELEWNQWLATDEGKKYSENCSSWLKATDWKVK